MSFQSAVENSGLKKSRGRSEGSLTQWNFQAPLREATNGDGAAANVSGCVVVPGQNIQRRAGLLIDLKRRGLLKDTLVVWAGEFGRTPFAQGSTGRDHNQYGFTVWLAGGGAKGGTAYGETDEWGYKVVRGKAEMHDLHATVLHLLGVDHKRLTFRFGGRDMRLTDVHGELIDGIIA